MANRMNHTGRDGEPPGLPRRHVEISDRAGLLEADQAGSHHAGGFHGRSMHVVAAHFIGLSEHDMHVLLTREFRIGQGFEQTPARVAMRLHGLHDDPCIRSIHAVDYSREAAVARGGRTTCRRPASSTPTTNIMSSQSKAPPPLLLGAVTVSDVEALDELPPADAVDSAVAAMAVS